MEAPIARRIGRPKPMVSRGTTKMPPPRPTSEPMRPAHSEAPSTNRKNSSCGSLGISGASGTEQEAHDEDAQHERRDRHVDPVALQRECHDRARDAQHGGRDQHQQTQRDDGQRVAMRHPAQYRAEGARIGAWIYATPAPGEIACIESHNADEDDACAQEHATAQHHTDDELRTPQEGVLRVLRRPQARLLRALHLRLLSLVAPGSFARCALYQTIADLPPEAQYHTSLTSASLTSASLTSAPRGRTKRSLCVHACAPLS